MNSNIIIECSQNNANRVYNDGDFEIKLAQPIFLENGDRFALSKTFLDNETEDEGVVVVPKGGITLYMQVQPYIQYDDLTKFQNGFQSNLAGSGIDGVDNAEYLLYQMNKDSSPVDPNNKLMELVTSIYFKYDGPRQDKTWGNTDKAHSLKFIAQNIRGEEFPVYVSLPPLKTKSEESPGGWYRDGEYTATGLDIYCKILQQNPSAGNLDTDISLVPDNTDGNWTYNKIKPVMGKPDESDNQIKSRTIDPSKGSYDLTPRFFDIDPIVIPEGKYTPEILVMTINDGLNATPFSKKVVDGVSNILPSAFLKQSFDLKMLEQPTDDQMQNERIHILLPSNPRFDQLEGGHGGIAGLQQPANPLPTDPPLFQNFLVGTNLVELAYSNDTNKYYWNYLHFPIYDQTQGNGNPIISKITKVGSGTTPAGSSFIQQGKNGGVIFHSLSATSINPKTQKVESYDFWSGVLGFNVGGETNSLIPPKKYVSNFTAAGLNQYSAYIPTLTDGINMTNAGFVIDDIVNKTTYQVFNLNSDGTIDNFEATSGFNNVIYAERSLVSNGILDTAYYLIEIQLNFSSNLIGNDSITRNISGIINRYYSKGSYVSAEGDPSFVINYQGEPTIISSMRIRILNPDKTVASLGSDNTLFFELIKAPPQIMQPQPQPQVKQK
jgi:hypothetical protein